MTVTPASVSISQRIGFDTLPARLTVSLPMKISLEWLGSYLPGFRGAQAAGEALTHGGLPVEVFEKHGDDDVIDVEVTSNRGDCLSHVGVARELAALLDRPFADIRPSATESATPPRMSHRFASTRRTSVRTTPRGSSKGCGSARARRGWSAAWRR